MITLFAKIFIKDRQNYSDGKVRKSYGVITGITGIFLNVILFLGKFIIGTISGAISITADAFNNLSDAGSSVLSLVGFLLADKKADPDHPFGHGRMEYITGLIVSIIIILMGFELCKSSIDKIIHPQIAETGIVTVVILLIAILVKIYMFGYNRIYGIKINSAAMKATSMDSLSDTVATLVVLLSVGISYFTNVNLDGYTGVLVSGFILFAGIKSVKETVSPLLGMAPEPEFVKQIYDIAMSHDEIVGVHDMVVHDYGPGRCMVSLHAEVSEKGNINELHDAIDNCENEIYEKLGCETTIHMDPVCVDDVQVENTKRKILNEIHKYNEKISIHDFRMVEGPTHTNIIFDAVLPVESKIKSEELKSELEKIVNHINENFYAVIKIDREYVHWKSQES